jgi:hypothetical protein
MLTGKWQIIANDGSERPNSPTIFEYFRKQTSQSAQSCFVVSGKSKLDALTYSSAPNFGSAYGASFVDGNKNDIQTWEKIEQTIDLYHPQLMMVNLAEVDLIGHDSSWYGYLAALRRADSIVGLVWNKIQSDSVYRNTTTMFVTNDHGRHDEQHGGPQFQKNIVVDDLILQVDLAPTSAKLADIKMPPVLGKNFLRKKGHP